MGCAVATPRDLTQLSKTWACITRRNCFVNPDSHDFFAWRSSAPRQASVGRYANGQSACIAKCWVRWSCHGLSRRLRRHFRTRFWRTPSDTYLRLSTRVRARPPNRERNTRSSPSTSSSMSRRSSTVSCFPNPHRTRQPVAWPSSQWRMIETGGEAARGVADVWRG
jgi:hypothetical protein